MKKLLLAAISAAAIAFAPNATAQTIIWTSAQTPVAETLTDGAYYLIYDHSKPSNVDQDRRAMRYVSSGTGTSADLDIQGNGTLVATTANSCDYNQYAWKAIKDGDNWKFQHVGTGKYIQAISAETKPLKVKTADATESNVGKWTLTYKSDEHGFKVKSTDCTSSNQYWDGLTSNDSYKMCTWGAPNDNSTHWYQFFRITDEMVVRTVTFIYPPMIEGGEAVTKTVNVQAFTEITVQNVPSLDFLTITGVTRNSGEENETYTVQGSFNFPITFETPYRLKLHDKYVNHASEHSITCDNSTLFNPYRIWYFKSKGVTDGYLTLTAHSLIGGDSDNQGLVGSASNQGDASYGEATVFQLRKNGDGFSLHINGTNSSNLNDFAGAGVVRTWTGEEAANGGDGARMHVVALTDADFDNTTSWTYDGENIALDDATAKSNAKANKDLASLRILFNPGQIQINHEYDHLIKYGDAISSISSADEQSKWEEAKRNATSKTAANVAALTTAYDAMYASLADDFIKIQGKSNTRDYLSEYNNNPQCVGNESAGKRNWTIKRAENGFYLRNEYFNKYLKHPATEGNVTFAAESDASSYNIVPVFVTANNVTTTYFAFYATDSRVLTSHYIKETNNETKSTADESISLWTIIPSTIEDAVTERVNGAVAAWTPSNSTALGGTHVKAEWTDAYNALNSIKDAATATAAEKYAAADALIATASAAGDPTYNKPRKGGFYRFKNFGSTQYLTGIAAPGIRGATRLEMSPADNIPEVVWYLDENNRLVNFANGLVIGQYSGANTTWSVYLSNNDNASAGTTFTGLANGRYYVEPSSGRHLYGSQTNNSDATDIKKYTDVGGGTDNDYQWVIEPVEWLMLPVYDVNGTKYATVNSPLPIDLNNRADAYESDLHQHTGRVAKLQRIAGGHEDFNNNVLPANTPALIVPTGYGNSLTDDYVYLHVPAMNGIDYSIEEKIESAVQSADYYAFAAAESSTYYTLGKVVNEAGVTTATGFVPTSGNVNGFKVWYSSTTAADGVLKIDLPIHEESAEGTYNRTEYTWTLAHSGNLSKRNHEESITFTRIGDASASNPEQAPKRRIIADGENSYKGSNNDITINEDNEAVINVTNLPTGTYEVHIPAEFFAVDDTHYTPEMNLTLVKDTDTGISEIIANDGVEGEIYDLQGRKLAAPVKGINIIGGRKVLVK